MTSESCIFGKRIAWYDLSVLNSKKAWYDFRILCHQNHKLEVLTLYLPCECLRMCFYTWMIFHMWYLQPE